MPNYDLIAMAILANIEECKSYSEKIAVLKEFLENTVIIAESKKKWENNEIHMEN